MYWRCGGLNSGLFACKANTLPLSYIPDAQVSNQYKHIHILYSFLKSQFEYIFNNIFLAFEKSAKPLSVIRLFF